MTRVPLVAIVGRPNVGKSTLFNRLIGRRRAIVQDDPGVTRDRHYGTATLDGRTVNLVDTGGLEPGVATEIEVLVREQTQLAIDEADLVLLVMDARDGLLAPDHAVVDLLRRRAKPVLHVINKVDGPKQEALAAEFFALGVPQLWCVSAEHALGVGDLVDAILAALPDAPLAAPAITDGAPEDPDEIAAAERLAQAGGDAELDNAEPGSDPPGAPEEIRVALVGRPNAGKSSLLNCLVGSRRAIVSATPGTTRDPVDVRLETPQGPYVVVDTAGIRRRRSVGTPMEQYAVVRALNATTNSDVACLLIDATIGVAEQDAKIAGLALEAGKGLVLVLTKSDLLVGEHARRELRKDIADKLQFIPYAPLLFVSSLSGAGARRVLSTVRRVHRACGTRISTGQLNRFLEEATSAHPPPAHNGRAVRFYYMVQPQAHPPTFLVSTNDARGVHITYRRFLANRLRERFGFEGTPLRLFLRQRGERGAHGERHKDRERGERAARGERDRVQRREPGGSGRDRDRSRR